MTSVARIRIENFLYASLDWRNFGVLNDDPPSQKGGTCWAYAVVAAVEANLQVNGINEKPSVQELIDCCYVPGGIEGGNILCGLRHIKLRGITTSTQYPTSLEPEGVCKKCNDKMRPRLQIREFTLIKDITVRSLMEAVKKTPVMVTFLADDLFEAYSKEDGVFTGKGSYPLDSNGKGVGFHSALIVGYDTEDGGVNEAGVGYWILRNSYGKEWGHNGYMKMDRALTHYFEVAVYPEDAGLWQPPPPPPMRQKTT